MGETYWSMHECGWVSWSPGAAAPAPAEVVPVAMPRQPAEDAEQPAVST
jgi:hypothetical protein